jgi:hypothetical protein
VTQIVSTTCETSARICATEVPPQQRSPPHLPRSAVDRGSGIRPALKLQVSGLGPGRDLKQVIDLRPVYHRKEERIRAHVLLCWLALLLIRVVETTCHAPWPILRRELERIKVGTFAGPAGSFHQRTEITTSQRAILAKLQLADPPRIYQLTPAAPAS